jgi:hypothetical protein
MDMVFRFQVCLALQQQAFLGFADTPEQTD